jgi:succinyl-CoA synthetase beta subunit
MNFAIFVLYSEKIQNPDKFYIMNIHEYQGKEILASYGVRIQRGIVANNAVEAVAAAKQLTTETGTSWFVIKAQVHAGGRGRWRSKTCHLQQVEESSRSNYWNAISYASNFCRR